MELLADVCVIGGGPAGLALVFALLGTGLRVTLLEGGNDREPQELRDIQLTGEEPYVQSSIHVTRAAYLGGTSGLWSYRMSNEDPEGGLRGCRYAPLDDIDFEHRAAVPHGGWPFGRAELDPWYAAAQPVCGLGRFDYTPEGWSRPGAQPLPLNQELTGTQMFQFAPSTAFTDDVLSALRADPNVQILTDANVTSLEPDAGADGDTKRIGSVRFQRPDGSAGVVRARATVLAAGGIENSRLLLIGDQAVRGGLGNDHDQVGRYWMEHPQARGGMLISPPEARLMSRLGLYDAHDAEGTKVMAKLTVPQDTVRALGLISTSVMLLPRDDVLARPAFQAYTELRSPSGRASSRAHKLNLAGRLAIGVPDLLKARKVVAKHPGLDHNGWTARPESAGLRVFEMAHQTEQTPDPDNRITLAPERDRYGRSIPKLHWRWSTEDRERLRRARDLYAQAFAEAGLGTVIQRDWDQGRPRMVGGNHHHMGGTRISPTSRTGVVDADLKVHGVQNLFVTGSSVFPAGGSVNPTLTIVALSLRLADHVKRSLSPTA
jgi:choline dehydrogenase-like flavoprotein